MLTLTNMSIIRCILTSFHHKQFSTIGFKQLPSAKSGIYNFTGKQTLNYRQKIEYMEHLNDISCKLNQHFPNVTKKSVFIMDDCNSLEHGQANNLDFRNVQNLLVFSPSLVKNCLFRAFKGDVTYIYCFVFVISFNQHLTIIEV